MPAFVHLLLWVKSVPVTRPAPLLFIVEHVLRPAPLLFIVEHVLSLHPEL